MTPWSPEEEELLTSGSFGFGIFFLLRTAEPIRLWAAIGDCEVGVNAVEGETQVYQGLGTLQDIPAFQSMINGRSERTAFRLSGGDDRILELARGDQAEINGKSVHLGFGLLRRDWSALAGPVRWVQRGRADYMTEIVETPEDNRAARRHAVELSVGSIFTGRKRPGLSYYTHVDQTARSPGDLFCERTPIYAQEYTKPFGPE